MDKKRFFPAEPKAVPGKPLKRDQPHPPSCENARAILLRAAEMGNARFSIHFNDRCDYREFSAIDAELLLETGRIIGGPDYDEQHHSWHYDFWGKVDHKGWKLIVALHCDSDLIQRPVATYVSIHQLSSRRASKKLEREKGE